MKDRSIFRKKLFMPLVLAILLTIALPISALVQLRILHKSTPSVIECINITAGGDDASSLVDVAVGGTVVPSTNSNMKLTQVTITMNVIKGGRNSYTDLIDINNTCSYAISSYLVIEPDPSGNGGTDGILGYSGDYLDFREYISKTANPTTYFSNATDWNNTAGSFIQVDSNGAGGYTIVTSQTATQVIPAASSRQVGIEVDASTLSNSGDVATFYVTIVTN